MFSLIVCLLVVTVCATAARTKDVCQGRKDGDVVEYGCWGYKDCQNETTQEHACGEGKVLERESLSCVSIGSNLTSCGQVTSCRVKADGMYPDVETGCKSFYSCFHKQFRGRYYCQKNLVFDVRLAACNYETDVPPPCGTSSQDASVRRFVN